MADLVITAANVIAGGDSRRSVGTAGATITAGQAVYRASATGLWMLADANAAAAEAKIAGGIALCGASANQPIVVHESGPVTIGAALTAGTAYYLSDTPGGICPLADVGSGEAVCLIGLASSTSVLDVGIQAPGVSL